MEEELFRLQTTALNEQWANFDLYRRPGIQYDYEVEINLLLLNISPEQINERQYRQEKQIADGWNYVYDKQGHIKVDSAG